MRPSCLRWRNSLSKTDKDATFMRMKEDHMGNGQLKPAYNVQLAVNSEYITGVAAFSHCTDSGTLIPFLEHIQRMQGRSYRDIVAATKAWAIICTWTARTRDAI